MVCNLRPVGDVSTGWSTAVCGSVAVVALDAFFGHAVYIHRPTFAVRI